MGKRITDTLCADGHDACYFGGFTLNLARQALLRGETEIPLRAKTFAVLQHLVARAGTLATKDELLDTAWPDAVVTQDTLTQSIVELRRALGDKQRNIIRTVPRRGFIFELPVSRGPVAEAPPRSDTLVQRA
jgi:DNA-binding winged helix-turn-helix (wHTH) protein